MSSFVPYEEAEISGLDNVKSMKMQTSGKAFFVIIAKIYSYKIRSMIREIACNASDIHKITGQTKPFIVTVPSEFNPMFTVRDFGTGLSEDGMSLFTTVFESSKEGSETETGYYGLGSKSPFAYTTSFNVISYYNGTMSHYTVFLDGAKEPKYAKVFEVPTTEENGLEIQISVESADTRTFIKEAQDVLSSMNTEYQLYGAEKLNKYHFFDKLGYSSYSNLPKFRKDIDTPDATIIITTASDRNHELKSNWFAQLGDVLYPIEQRELRHVALPDHFGVMKFSPKDLDIPPSRETLEYTPKTEKAIQAKVELVNKQINEYFSSDHEPDSISNIEYISYKGFGSSTKFQYTFISKTALHDSKVSFAHNTSQGFTYRTQLDADKRLGTNFPVFIYDTQRASTILKQYSLLKMKHTACHIISLVDAKTRGIVYSSAYAKKFKNIKDRLVETGHTVFLISELEKEVKLDKPKPKAVMYKLNQQDESYVPTLLGDLTKADNVLFYNSSDFGTENTITTIIKSGLFSNTNEFDIYKVQNSKMSYCVDKFKKKYPSANILTNEGDYFRHLASKTINFNILDDVQLCSLYIEQEEYYMCNASSYRRLSSIGSLYDLPAQKDTIVKYATLLYSISTACNNRSHNVITARLSRVKINASILLDEIKNRGINIETLLTFNDIAKNVDCGVLDSTTQEKNRVRNINFVSTAVKNALINIL